MITDRTATSPDSPKGPEFAEEDTVGSSETPAIPQETEPRSSPIDPAIIERMLIEAEIISRPDTIPVSEPALRDGVAITPESPSSNHPLPHKADSERTYHDGLAADTDSSSASSIENLFEGPETGIDTESYGPPYVEGWSDLPDVPSAYPVSIEAASQTSEYVSSPIVSAAEAAEIWMDELRKDPQEILEDFIVTLQLLSTELQGEASWEQLDRVALEETDGGAMLSGDRPNEDGYQYDILAPERFPAPLPGVIRSVAEKLTGLGPEPREAAAVYMQQITGAVHGLHLLTSREASAEQIKEAEEMVNELCEQLFVAIGLEYSEADIRAFTHFILDPQFRTDRRRTHNQQPIDLSVVGTREAKRPKYMAITSDENSRVHALLGTFALFYSALLQREVTG